MKMRIRHPEEIKKYCSHPSRALYRRTPNGYCKTTVAGIVGLYCDVFYYSFDDLQRDLDDPAIGENILSHALEGYGKVWAITRKELL